MGVPLFLVVGVMLLAVVLVIVKRLQRGDAALAPNRRRGAAAGVMGALVAIGFGASGALRERNLPIVIPVAIGALVLVIGVIAFLKSQNSRS